jgi:predicted Fe-Mo cluster-binding NifX family protein
MRLAITTSGPDLEAPVDVQFGRAKGFVFVDPETWRFQFLDSREGSHAGLAAAIQAAGRMAAHDVQVLLTGHCDPNAFRVLQAAGIRVCTGLAGGTVREAVERFSAGALQEAAAADAQGHW